MTARKLLYVTADQKSRKTTSTNGPAAVAGRRRPLVRRAERRRGRLICPFMSLSLSLSLSLYIYIYI